MYTTETINEVELYQKKIVNLNEKIEAFEEQIREAKK